MSDYHRGIHLFIACTIELIKPVCTNSFTPCHAALGLRSITSEFGSVIDKWFQIGVQLGISESKLRQIESNHYTVEICFSEMIGFWLNGNTQVPVTWNSLIDILESPFINEKGLANKLREKTGLEVHNEEPTPSLTGKL